MYLAYLERWLDEITPMLAGAQITECGHTILWQVENEFGYGNKPYIMRLLDRARRLGIDVPIVPNSGHYYAE
ncbi:beta-galactosidase [Paenibacillus taihuensis]|uniref:Beta-galactosidase n=1 Tax=Paenibacillus taihuensis TaxID=1156355 RepID=A0A3D9SA46_9BACL|nr:beta-galactosidase [Paenibacillus taihuensis]